MKPLTRKQQALVTAVAEGLPYPEAYKKAYDCAENLSPAICNTKCYEVLNKPNVAARLAELKKSAAAAALVTVQRVVEEYAKIAFATLPGIIDFQGGTLTLRDFDNLTPEQKAVIKRVKYRETESASGMVTTHVDVELYDKQAALDSLAKYLGMFVDRHEVKSQSVSFNLQL